MILSTNGSSGATQSAEDSTSPQWAPSVTLSDYDFWEDVYDYVQSEHEQLLGWDECAVIEAHCDSHHMWSHKFDSVQIARAFVTAMTQTYNGSQFYIVGADINE